MNPGTFRGRGIKKVTGGERGSPRTAPGKRGGDGESSFNGSVLSSYNATKQYFFMLESSKLSHIVGPL